MKFESITDEMDFYEPEKEEGFELKNFNLYFNGAIDQ